MEYSLFFLLALGSFILEAHSAYFSSKPAVKVKAKIGQNVTFPWNFVLENDEELVLMKLQYSKTSSFESSSQRIAYRTRADSLKIDKKFVSVENSGALTLYNVTVEDRGFYKCHIELNEGEPLWDKVELVVGAPPVIQPFSASEINLLEGASLNINCHVSGQPAPRVCWSRQTARSDRWDWIGSHSFEISNAKLSDSGLYECNAFNDIDSANRTIKVNVHERPKVTTFYTTAALDGTIFECQQVIFTCEILGTRPVSKFHIFHDNSVEPLVTGSNSGNFKIPEVTKRHAGRYYCVPENKHGRGLNRTIELKVIDAPENCKKTSTVKSDEITDIPTSSPYVTEGSLQPSNKGNSVGRHVGGSGSEICRSSMVLLIISWAIYSTCKCVL